MILAGDVGGTKTVLALCDGGSGGGAPRVMRSSEFPCAEFESFDRILDEFLRPRDAEALQGACFGVAGPVTGTDGDGGGGVAKITNLPWTIDARLLATRFGGIRVSLLNDLQATALGMLVLPADKFAVLQPQQTPTTHGTIAVIAPGTGLGEATLVWDHGRYRALPSEGGHADFAPITDDEIELLVHLRKRYRGHVSYERVLSGDGLGDIYDFVRERATAKEPTWLAHEIAAGDRNAAISKAALANEDEVCVRALEMFVEILGAEAGNIALRNVAGGGVVIGGGIPPKILPALQTGKFIERFNDKGRFSSWTGTLGVRVTLEPRAALLGAAHYVATDSPWQTRTNRS